MAGWTLQEVYIADILAFRGARQIVFQQGLQVIYADNHSGKTSVAVALLWALNGQLPAISRINATKFKLKHKGAAEDELGLVRLRLVDGDGAPLLIERTVKKGAKTELLAVDFGGRRHEGAEAQQLIDNLIGLKPHSLEGCCIVMQDQRLNLIAGNQKSSSDVIHDILGLSLLSKLEPILVKQMSKLESLIKEMEPIDPAKRWEDTHKQLVEALKEKEAEAVAAGIPAADFNRSGFLSEEFQRLHRALGTELPADAGAKERVASLRAAVAKRRADNPLRARQYTAEKQAALLREASEKFHGGKHRFKEEGAAYAQCANTHKIGVGEITPKLIALEDAIKFKDGALQLLKEQHGLYAHSLKLLRSDAPADRCPLCSQSIARDALIREIEGKLDETTRHLLAQLDNEIHILAAQKKTLEDLAGEYRQMEGAMRQALETMACAAAAAGIDSSMLTTAKNDPLHHLNILMHETEKLDAALKQLLTDALNELAQANNHLRHEEEQWAPHERQLDNIALYLIPIHEIHEKLLRHEAKKEKGSARSTAFAALLEKARRYCAQLKGLREHLQRQEKENANRTMEEHRQFVSRFFVKVAGNPCYDTIGITAEQMHGSIKYDIVASSTQGAAFTDAARHVLSGGDLSCACLGLTLSLMKGKSNKANFLVLDDPGESLDATRIGNLAEALAGSGERQTVVLTHQRELYEKLLAAGAATVDL